ncbi:MAG: helix-turn-helix domain-containing protein [Thermoplasmata archaeon]
MRRRSLSDNEKCVLYGLVRYTQLSDRELSERLGVKHSTLTTIKHRLAKNGYFIKKRIPFLQNVGCELLGVTYADFNPAVSAEARVEKARKRIEIYDELFYSVGETNNGFSLSFSKNYTSIEKIGDIRTQLFAELGLLEGNFPTQVIFPFETSSIIRFLDYSRLLADDFDIEEDEGEDTEEFVKGDPVVLKKRERIVLYALVKYPEGNDGSLADMTGLSRHTISNIRRRLEDRGLIRTITIPNLNKLGFEILCFGHMRLSPKTPFDAESVDMSFINTDSVVFLAAKRFENIMLSIYRTYEDFKVENSALVRYLKENDMISDMPLVRLYSIGRMITIKDLVFGPFVKRLLDLKVDF